jgi:ADP-heptose:LPS heptosyltransferase
MGSRLRMSRLGVALTVRKTFDGILRILNAALFPETGRLISHLRKNPGRLLILRTGNVGDTACAVPALMALRQRFPQARLTLLTSPGLEGLPGAGELLEPLGLIDEVTTFYRRDLRRLPFFRGLIRKLRGRRYHLFILLPQGRASFRRLLRDLGFAYFLGVQGALGFRLGNHFPLMPPGWLKDYISPFNEAERLLKILEDAGIPPPGSFALQLPETALAAAEELLHPFLSGGPRLIIGLQMTAKVKAKLWPPVRFTELCRRLQETYQPLFLFTGSPSERDMLRQFADTFPGDKLVAAGRACLIESLALISKCRVLVSLDTGPMHLAALVKTPVVSLFGGRNFPKEWDPWGDGVILRARVPCEPCFRDDCHRPLCMEAISVDAVVEVVRNLIEESEPSHDPSTKNL